MLSYRLSIFLSLKYQKYRPIYHPCCCDCQYLLLSNVLTIKNNLLTALYTHTHTHTHTYIYIYIYVNVYICQCKYQYTCVCIFTCVARIYIYIYIYICVCVCVCIFICVCMCICACICACICVYELTYQCVPMLVASCSDNKYFPNCPIQ